MSKVDSEKLEKFTNYVEFGVEFFSDMEGSLEEFINPVMWFSRELNIAPICDYATQEVSDEVKIQSEVMAFIKRDIGQLKSWLEVYGRFGSKFATNDFFKDIYAKELLEPNKFYNELQKIDKWCDERTKKQMVIKKGRKKDLGLMVYIVLSEICHYHVFGKYGALSPDGYYIKTVQKALEGLGIVMGSHGVKSRIERGREEGMDYNRMIGLGPDRVQRIASKFNEAVSLYGLKEKFPEMFKAAL